MKISLITDILVLRFYRYVGDILDISVDILKQNMDVKINKNFEYIKKNLKNYIKSENRYLKLFFNIYIYAMKTGIMSWFKTKKRVKKYKGYPTRNLKRKNQKTC